MISSFPRLRAFVVGTCAVALVIVGAGGSLAASSPPILWACFNANGQVAMATIPQCRLAGGGQLVQVNAQGIPGPAGPQGAPGAVGPTGAPGAAGAGAPVVRHTGTAAFDVQVEWPGPNGEPPLLFICGSTIQLVSSGGGISHIWTSTTVSSPNPPGPIATLDTPLATTPGAPRVTGFTAVAGDPGGPFVFQGVITTGTQAEGCTYDVVGPF